MTIDLKRRLWQHQNKFYPRSFSAQYNVFKPVYYEGLESVEEALERERFIKGKNRKWKEDLVKSINPEWRDLSDEIRAMKP